LEKDINEKNLDLERLIELFESKFELERLRKLTHRELEILLQYSIKLKEMFKKYGVLEARKLLQKGMMIVRRVESEDEKEKNMIIGPRSTITIPDENKIVIRDGQHESNESILIGLGRKFTIERKKAKKYE